MRDFSIARDDVVAKHHIEGVCKTGLLLFLHVEQYLLYG